MQDFPDEMEKKGLLELLPYYLCQGRVPLAKKLDQPNFQLITNAVG
jgi:hypothetical protein